MNSLFIQVAVPVPIRQLFTYQVPDALASKAMVLGERVLVPFGHRQLIGIVCQVSEQTELCQSKLKSILARIDDDYHFDAKMLTLLTRCSQYYHHPIGDVMQQALPVLFRNIEQDKASFDMLWHRCEQADGELSKQAVKQQALLNIISERCGVSWPELTTLGFSKAQLNALKDKGFITEKPLIPTPFTWQAASLASADKLSLSVEQSLVVSSISQSLNNFSCHLIDGITGSGKTEVYLQAMEQILAASQQVLVLVPEIGLTPQTLTRFEQRFKLPIFLHHSGLNDKERLDSWRAGFHGHAAIIIGTRSAIFTPMPNLGMIIIDEEHDASFKQQDSFRYHGRDVAILRAKQLNIPILLGTATPSFESLHNAKTGKYHYHQLTKRAGNSQPAQLSLVNCHHQQMEHGISGTVKHEIAKRLANDEQVLIFLNRRGYAPAIHCNACNSVIECHRCNKPYTFHQQNKLLICHHCGSQKRMPKQCSNCGSARLTPVGQGTEQIEQYVQAWFAQSSIVRIDRDSTRKKGSFNKVIQAIHNKQHQILIGTQMLAKGHHFPDVTLVVILDIDGALFSFDYRATEYMAQLLVQVSGRAGRASKPGQVLIQSHYPEHPLLQDLVHNGYHHFAEQSLSERQLAKLPPYHFQALIRAEANNPYAPETFLRKLTQLDLSPCQTAGPIPAAMEKKAGKYRYHLILQAEQRSYLHLAIKIGQLLLLTDDMPEATKTRWTIDVDPIDFSW